MTNRILIVGIIGLIGLLGSAAGQTAPGQPPFNSTNATLTVGSDGRVYMTSLGPGNEGYVLRLNRDGSDRVCAPVTYMTVNATANPDGTMGVAFMHFARNVTIYRPDFAPVGQFSKFCATEGLSTPIHVESAPSGDFYAADQYRDRILRFHPDGIRCGTYLVPREPDGPTGEIRDFRVCERTNAIYVLTQGPLGTIRCLLNDLPGWKSKCRKKWSIDSRISWGEPHIGGGTGAFDVDANGILYVTDGCSDVIRRFSADGEPMADVKLQAGDRLPKFPGERGFNYLRVFGNDIILHRPHPTELFQRYDLTGGSQRNVVEAGRYGSPEQRAKGQDDMTTKESKDTEDQKKKDEKKPIRVLFIGNSQVSCVADIPEIVEDLSHSSPADAPRVQADAVVIGGVPLEKLWDDGRARTKIRTGNWDWVVVQEMIGYPETQKELMFKYVRLFHEAIEQAGAKMLLFAVPQVEGKRDAHRVIYDANLEIAREFNPAVVAEKPGVLAGLTEKVTGKPAASRTVNVRVAGCGAAWLKAWAARPNLNLHHTDRAHPNILGYYLNACVIYAAITDRNPAGLDPCGLPPQDAQSAQKIAWYQYSEDRENE